MQASDFTNERTGELVPTVDGALAFVPAALPPTNLGLDWALADRLSRAENALGQLEGMASKLVSPYLILNPLLRREAILSNRIEGTFTTAKQLALFEAAGQPESANPDASEVLSYVRAMERGLKLLESLPVCLRLIREVHSTLLKNVRGSDKQPGKFRTVQNAIGATGQTLVEARFVPPPPIHLKDCLSDFERYLNSEPNLPQLVRLALIHYQFEAIHPFLDGNGRVGRLLLPLLLCAQKRLSQPLVYVSGYFEKYRQQYADKMLRVSQAGEWTDWVGFFLDAIAEQSRQALESARRLLELQAEYRSRVQRARASPLAPTLVDRLFQTPAITLPATAKFLEVTHRSATNIVDKLVEFKILEEVTGRARNRIFLAREIVEISES
jgi:Fic family protein